jgi:leucyl aminopeptidase
MKWSVSSSLVASDALVVGVYSDELDFKGMSSDVKKIVWPLAEPLIKAKVIEGKAQTMLPFVECHVGGFKSVFLVGLGDRAKVSSVIWRNAVGDVARVLNQYHIASAVIVLPNAKDEALFAQATSEGLAMGLYRFDTYKTEKKTTNLKAMTLLIGAKSDAKGIKKGLADGEVVARSVNLARELANMPANDLYPRSFVEKAKALFSEFSTVSLKVIDAKEAGRLGMGAFLGVAQGSVNEPYMLVITYAPKAKQAPICLVGKGITFDSGGISIKPAKGMGDMKADMSGAANVLSAMLAICTLKPNRNVTAIMPLAENMVSGNAQRPGDIVKAMNGKTIEITNTDAEGRLILADALCYAVEKVKPSEIIDMATLTGACVVALGTFIAGVMGNTQDMVDRMVAVGQKTGERLWQLPLFDEYLYQLKSDVADINHCYEGREGGTITAAKFLEQFVDKTPWIHLDIAGVMDYSKTSGCKVKGMSGEGTRNLIEYVIQAV